MTRLARGIFALGILAVVITGAVAVSTEAWAACRRAPQCAVDSDCDAICGVGQGHCVHSNCPVRICKCR